jgi:phage-related holin
MKNTQTIMKSPNFLGFDSVSDFFNSLFKPSNWDLNFIGAAIATITTFISGYIWDSPTAIWTLWVLMGADWFTGIWKSMLKKQFVSYKIFRMPLYFIATSFALSISWWLSKSSILFTPLPSIVYGGFAAVYFVSMLENLGEIGLLPKSIVDMLKARFGLKAIVEKWDKKEEENK